MKIILVSVVVLSFGCAGYLYKYKLKQEYLFLKYLKEFNDFFQSNIVLFKNNTVEIINSFIIMQKNKNANYNKLFIKNTNIYTFNKEILKLYISSDDTLSVLSAYFLNIGNNEYEYENEKNKNISNFLNLKINQSFENFNNKGGLYFKLLLSVGAIIGILIW